MFSKQCLKLLLWSFNLKNANDVVSVVFILVFISFLLYYRSPLVVFCGNTSTLVVTQKSCTASMNWPHSHLEVGWFFGKGLETWRHRGQKCCRMQGLPWRFGMACFSKVPAASLLPWKALILAGAENSVDLGWWHSLKQQKGEWWSVNSGLRVDGLMSSSYTFGGKITTTNTC